MPSLKAVLAPQIKVVAYDPESASMAASKSVETIVRIRQSQTDSLKICKKHLKKHQFHWYISRIKKWAYVIKKKSFTRNSIVYHYGDNI